MAKAQARARGVEGRGEASGLGKMAILNESVQCVDTEQINTGDNRTRTLPKSTSTLILQAGKFSFVVPVPCTMQTFSSVPGLSLLTRWPEHSLNHQGVHAELTQQV